MDRIYYIDGNKCISSPFSSVIPKIRNEVKKEKKYELIETKVQEGYSKYLKQTRALKDFGDIKKGDLGGHIASEDNLSQEGDCWIYEDALVYEYANVSGDAKVHGEVEICGRVRVCENAKLRGALSIFGHVEISGDIRFSGSSCAYDPAGQETIQISGDAKISGNLDMLTDIEY